MKADQRAAPVRRSPRRLELRAAQLRRRVDPRRLGFASTEDVEPLVGTIGQPRALDALEYGLAVGTRGFNLFVAGLPGSGRLTTVLDYLHALAGKRATPSDWIYVHDFANVDRPNAVQLPAGRGTEFAGAMDEFVEAVRREIPRAFESEEYDRRQREILAEIAAERQEEEDALTSFAAERMIALKTTLVGVASVPLVDGKPITRERFEHTPAAQIRPTPLITGHDLIALGIRPGPSYKDLLAAAEDAQLECQIESREEALDFVRQLLLSNPELRR
jgi:hypothetical protein